MKIALLLALATVASAAPLYTTQTTLTAADGPDINGVISSPYTLQLGEETVSAWCDDFLDQITLAQTWQANVYSGTAVEGAYFPTSDYAPMFWLVVQGNANPLARIDIQQALWSIEDLDYVGTVASSSWLAEARREAPHVDPSLFRVISGAVQSGARAQEFILEVTSSPVPEPGTWMMLIGVLGMIGMAKWRRW